MKVITWLDDAEEIITNSAVALGNFDGIHKGHQSLMKKTVEVARSNNLEAVVFTFANHPTNEIAGKIVVKNIMDIFGKATITESLGIDYMVNTRFDRFIMKLEPEEFVEKILVKKLHIKHAVCGFNYSFGYKGLGTPQLLIEMGKKYGFDVSIVPELKIDGQTVSSTYIRTLIEKGEMEKYRLFTGRTYKIGGFVMYGQQIGRTIGFPTANLSLTNKMALPCNGVYITDIYVNNQILHSVTNVGNKPTVGEFEKNAETHIFNFDGNIYGERIVVEFIKLLRPEKKFNSIDELSAQIEKDCIDARKYHRICD